MALVRCPKHNIPYNDANPRGCPACWQEKQGDEGASAIQELARASRGVPSMELPDTSTPPAVREGTGDLPAPVTAPPRVPTPEPTALEKLVRFAKNNWTAVGGVVGIAIVIVLIYVITKPTFRERFDPPLLTSDAFPFPVAVDAPIDAAFAIFGTIAPSVNPDSPSLARYRFEPGVFVDALNSAVYAITLTSTERVWNGNRVGLTEQLARGRLALLGDIADESTRAANPFPVGPWLVFTDGAARSARVLTARVRPPNGCFDVQIQLSPRIIGEVTRDEERFVAVARQGGTPEWVVVQVRVVSRALDGPYADGGPEC